MACLPLLRPGNVEAKTEYLKILPLILNHSVENGCHIEESRQLLSYSLIHPAMTTSERSQLSVWLCHLEKRYANSIRHQGVCNEGHCAAPELISQYLDKNVHSNEAMSHVDMHKSGATWQQIGSRDSGIVVNGGERISPTNEMMPLASTMTNPNHGTGGRAITSTAAINPGIKSTNLQAAVDINLNGAGLVVDSHSQLHTTLSGPAAYSNVPSTQGQYYNCSCIYNYSFGYSMRSDAQRYPDTLVPRCPGLIVCKWGTGRNRKPGFGTRLHCT